MQSDTENEQITATGLLNDAFARRKPVKISTKVDIIDLDELKDYQLRKRTEYEGYLKRNRLDIGQWMRYALFEIEQYDMRRARSIFERALLVDNSHIPLWIRYVDCELKFKYINHARNLLDRAVSTLPRVDKLWYKYLLLEESLGNADIVRSLFNKWTSLEPGIAAWDSYVDFEIRQSQWDNVRAIYARYVTVFPETIEIWFKWIGFETNHGNTSTIRKVYSLAVDTLMSHEDSLQRASDFQKNTINLIISFANWEASKEELERAKAIFQIVMEKWPQDITLKNAFLNLQKRYDDASTLYDSILQKRKLHYETILTKDPKDYDTWWVYLDLIEEKFPSLFVSALAKATDIKNKPPISSLSNMIDIPWQRYLFLWIRRLIYTELQLNDVVECRNLYNEIIDKIIPHSHFTYNKIWIMFAHFEIRQDNISNARKILGKCIGMCPSEEIFEEYINVEIKLKEFDRVRTLYEKFIEYDPNNLSIWFNYTSLEENLGDEDRARGIFNIMLNNEVTGFNLDKRIETMERLITFETDAEEYDNGRNLYKQYLLITDYSVKTWISYAMYQCSVPTEEQLQQLSEKNENTADMEDGDDSADEIQFEPTEVNFNLGRKVYEEALTYFKGNNDPQKRLEILKAMQEFEMKFGDVASQQAVSKRMPTLRKEMILQDGIETEHIEYVFPDDIVEEPKTKIPKLLALANKWKQQQDK